MWFCKEKVAGNKASEERRVQALGGACWSRHYSGGNSEPLNGQKQSRGEIVLEALGRTDLVSQWGSYLAGSSDQHLATCREFCSSELSTLNIWTGFLQPK